MNLLPIAVVAAYLALPDTSFAQTRWVVDRGASELGFVVTLGGRENAGGFETWSADILFDPAAPDEADVEVTVDIGSVVIDVPQVAEKITAPAWLGAAMFPEATFRATALTWTPTNAVEVPGLLTLKGVATGLVLTGTLTIVGNRATAQLGGTISRLAHQVGTADPAVAPDIRLTVHLEAVAQ